MKTRIIYNTIFSIAFLGLMICCSGKNTSSKEGANIVINMPLRGEAQLRYDTLQLGKVNEGEVVTVNIDLKNVDTKPLVITNVLTGCGCTTIDYDKSPIKAGESRTFTIEYNSKGQYGRQLKAIEIISSDNTFARVFLNAHIENNK